MVFHLALTQTVKEQERCLTKKLESGEMEKKDVNSNFQTSSFSFETFKISFSGKVSKLKITKKISNEITNIDYEFQFF